jgi:hypothetical protein
LKILTTLSNDLEASLITGHLQKAGIHSMQRSEQLPQYTIGPHSILVEDDEYARARYILAQDEGGFDEDELARLSEQAVQQPTQTPGHPGRRRRRATNTAIDCVGSSPDTTAASPHERTDSATKRQARFVAVAARRFLQAPP